MVPLLNNGYRCNHIGQVISVSTGVLTSGRDNKILSDIEKRHIEMVAKSRDRVLRERNVRRERMIEFRRTSSTTTTTTTTSTTTTTTSTTSPSTTSRSNIFISDPTLNDDSYYDEYYENYFNQFSDDYTKETDSDRDFYDHTKDKQIEEDTSPILCSYSSWSPWSACSSGKADLDVNLIF